MRLILVAEDDELNRDVAVRYLENEGFRTVAARDGMAALRLARDGVDLAVLDLGLPAIDGLNVIRTLRGERNDLPIVVVSARIDEVDRIVAFEAGADDYMPKPFLPRELVYRVRSLLRRARPTADAPRHGLVARFGTIEIDEAAREMRVGGEVVKLRPREFALVAALAAHPGIAMARRTLIDRAWGSDFDGDERTVDGHIRCIRQKLDRYQAAQGLIATIYGFGYKFSAA